MDSQRSHLRPCEAQTARFLALDTGGELERRRAQKEDQDQI